MMMKIKPFLDAHYGPLNDNYRFWFGALLLVRAVILLISALIPTNRADITVYSINVCALVLMTGFAVGVYKSSAVATFNAVWFVNLGLLSASYNTMFTILLKREIVSYSREVFVRISFCSVHRTRLLQSVSYHQTQQESDVVSSQGTACRG